MGPNPNYFLRNNLSYFVSKRAETQDIIVCIET